MISAMMNSVWRSIIPPFLPHNSVALSFISDYIPPMHHFLRLVNIIQCLNAPVCLLWSTSPHWLVLVWCGWRGRVQRCFERPRITIRPWFILFGFRICEHWFPVSMETPLVLTNGPSPFSDQTETVFRREAKNKLTMYFASLRRTQKQFRREKTERVQWLRCYTLLTCYELISESVIFSRVRLKWTACTA